MSTEAAAAAATATPAAQASILDTLATKEPPASIAPAPTAAEGAGARAPSWRDTLPDDIRADEGLSKFDSIKDDAERNAAIARSYVSAQKLIGGDKLPKPKGPDDKEALDAVYTALGRPESPEKYVIERPKDLPPGLQVDEAGETFLKSFAHQNGWNQQQMTNAYKAFFEHKAKEMAEGARIHQNSYEDAMRALNREGNATETLTLAKATVQQYADAEVIALLKQSGLDNHPVIIRHYAKIGKDLTGHQVLKGRGEQTIETGAQIKAQIDKHRQENHGALYDASHPGNRAAVTKLDELYQRLHGTGAQA